MTCRSVPLSRIGGPRTGGPVVIVSWSTPRMVARGDPSNHRAAAFISMRSLTARRSTGARWAYRGFAASWRPSASTTRSR
jgi:hypothetical protein